MMGITADRTAHFLAEMARRLDATVIPGRAALGSSVCCGGVVVCGERFYRKSGDGPMDRAIIASTDCPGRGSVFLARPSALWPGSELCIAQAGPGAAAGLTLVPCL